MVANSQEAQANSPPKIEAHKEEHFQIKCKIIHNSEISALVPTAKTWPAPTTRRSVPAAEPSNLQEWLDKRRSVHPSLATGDENSPFSLEVK